MSIPNGLGEVMCKGLNVATSIGFYGSQDDNGVIALNFDRGDSAGNYVIGLPTLSGASAGQTVSKTLMLAGDMPDDSVTTDAIEDSAVTAAKLASGSVVAAKIGAGAVGSSALADSACTTAKINDGACTTAKLADSSITAAKLASGSVGSEAIASSAVDTNELASDCVTEAKIAANAVATEAIKSDISIMFQSEKLEIQEGSGSNKWRWVTVAASGSVPAMIKLQYYNGSSWSDKQVFSAA